METIKTLEFQGKKLEVRKFTSITKIDANGGAAPWKIGTQTKKVTYGLFVDGEDIIGISWAKTMTDKDLIEYAEFSGAL
jgi:hypothetical protein